VIQGGYELFLTQKYSAWFLRKKELVQQIAATMDKDLIFPKNSKPEDLEQKIRALQAKLDGFRKSFECLFLPPHYHLPSDASRAMSF
jgi:hypothetical protein